jgi:F-type H+-transporting ATPase subunit c
MQSMRKEGEHMDGLLGIAAGIAVFTGVGAGIGIGIATGKAAEGISRQPEASGKIMSQTILGAALAEATAIYGFVIALIILFVKSA